MIFKMHECGLHYYDPSDEQFTFTNTVEGNMAGYTKRQLKGATSARFLYKKLAYPSVGDFRWVVQANQIEECPVTVQDIDVAAQVWGKDLDALKGKTKRSRPIHVASDFVKVPRELLKLHKEVFLTADIFFVNKIPFFLSISRNIRFITVEVLDNRKQASLVKALHRLYGIYRKRGFRITNILGDSEFECTRGAVATDLRSKLNICGKVEHVPDIERCIRPLYTSPSPRDRTTHRMPSSS